MKKVILIILLALGTQLVCAADTWSELLRAYKMDLSTLARGNGYQKEDYTPDSYSGYALPLLEKDIKSNIKDIDRNSIGSYTDKP